MKVPRKTRCFSRKPDQNRRASGGTENGRATRILVGLLAICLAGCGGSGSNGNAGPGPNPTEAPGPTPTSPAPVPTQSPASSACDDTTVPSYSGTFAGIQERIFERRGCTQDVCHGSSQSGALDLRADAAWAELVEAPAVGSRFNLVEPGDRDLSYLWHKLVAASRPEEATTISGSPMPIGAAPLTDDDLELLRRWIYAGAPKTGTVPDTAELLGACLPPAEPISILPLSPPLAGEGLQLVMPSYPLPAGREREVCFATLMDFTGQVPAEALDETGTHFRISSTKLRQDAHSHHLILNLYEGSYSTDHPSFGAWTCSGGTLDGQGCDPQLQGSCAEGLCMSKMVDVPGCAGFGPNDNGFAGEQLLVVQQPQETQDLPEGTYRSIPLRAIVFWNSHSFNLTDKDHEMNGRINWTFARDADVPVVPIFASERLFGMSVPAFDRQTICTTLPLPERARLFNLIGHTHKRGKRFWVEDPSGTQIYENFVYNDPVNQYYNPPLAFDSTEIAERTIRFCAYYENGLDADGAPDATLVKRRSETPQNAFGLCAPTHCAEGRVAETCAGVGDDASCDSAAGAGDGRCDACRLQGGVSTEEEMFLLLGAYYVEPETTTGP